MQKLVDKKENMLLIIRVFILLFMLVAFLCVGIPNGDIGIQRGFLERLIVTNAERGFIEGPVKLDPRGPVSAVTLEQSVSWLDAFLGLIPGSMGETSTLACLIGAIVLVVSGIAGNVNRRHLGITQRRYSDYFTRASLNPALSCSWSQPAGFAPIRTKRYLALSPAEWSLYTV